MSKSTIVVPWGEMPHGIPPVLQETPQLGDVDPAQVRTVHAPVMVRLDASGGLHLCSGRGGIVHCGPDGTIAGTTPLPSGRPVDYAVGTDVVIVLTGQQLLALDREGHTRWEVTGSFAGVLLGEGGQLFVPERDQPVVRRMDVMTGRTVRTIDRRPDAGRLFLAAGGLCAVHTDLDAGVRGVEVITGDGESVVTAFPDREHYAWLVHPIGFDERLSVYVWRDDDLARVTLEGQIEQLGRAPAVDDLPPPNLWQVTPDGHIVIAHSDPAGVKVLTLVRGRG